MVPGHPSLEDTGSRCQCIPGGHRFMEDSVGGTAVSKTEELGMSGVCWAQPPQHLTP